MEAKASIIGVDFSGAALAGEKIWVAVGEVEGDALQITFLERAKNLPDGSPERETAFPPLVSWLQSFSNARVGFDFPFALQKSNLKERHSWRDWILSLPTLFQTADEFRGEFPDDKRKADIDAKTPLSPLNLRLYRQTYHGMRDVLAPLLRDGARALPFEVGDEGLVLMEICPASLLKKEKLYISYKGKSETQLLNREAILSAIAKRYNVEIDDDLRHKAVSDTEGDALDAILGAVCVFKTKDFSAKHVLDEFEGRVYF